MEKLAKVVKTIASEIPLTLWAGKLSAILVCFRPQLRHKHLPGQKSDSLTIN
ncbi:hypothetical protein [Dapis sp. BLCC M229]|uniref:hypothetical protein n=1 Tax=Dapis sp. BLCC M229 TaxID=3400188 RepID=UPI003CECD094